ncbi:MAG: single-stranded DNA-binding protein [Puniceicoccales bacterium]|jgi:single-strand selective monofunctional uracil DNA glycosylase|nr:single-stranded DNA-binding protein [Puniceicoccales bacterium]
MSRPLAALTRELAAILATSIRPVPPAAYIYNPLEYARAAHEEYLARYATAPKRILFLGMNPGPYGMAQTGVPFGEVNAVRDFLHINTPIGAPSRAHPAKPVQGFHCPRSEVSGRRLWALIARHFGTAENFFRDHYVHNHCPLLFLDDTARGKNVTPEQLPREQRAALTTHCDAFLRVLVARLRIRHLVAIGNYAEKRAAAALDGIDITFHKIPHPSPASPSANKNWDATAAAILHNAGLWPRTL